MSKQMRSVASAAERMIACPGSVALEARRVRGSGTKEHARLERVMVRFVEEGEMGADVNADFASYLRLAMRESARVAGPLLVEDLIRSDAFPLPLSGRPDCYAVGATEAVVIDYKSGLCRVHADCDQMMSYAVIICANNPSVERVRLIIVQPAVEDSVADLTRAEVEAYVATTLIPAQQAVLRASAAVGTDEFGEHLNPGDACRFCPIRSACPAFAASCARSKMTLSRRLANAAPAAASSMSDEELAEVAEAAPGLRAFLNAIEREIRARG